MHKTYDQWKTRSPDDGHYDEAMDGEEDVGPMNKDYWRGYIDAIRHADIQLQSRGDDRITRYARRNVLKLAGVKFDPNHVVPIPEWPPEEEWIMSQPNTAPKSD